MSDLRETIARLIWDHELRRSGDHDDPYCAWPERGFSDPRTWDYQETADAVLAAIGTPDATGDLLQRAAAVRNAISLERNGPPGDNAWECDLYSTEHIWNKGSPELEAFDGYGSTATAALQAALAKVEEAGA